MRDVQQDVAVETLYAWYCEEKKDASDILPSEFVSKTLYDVVRQQPLIDKILEKHAENWAFERIAKVDLAILRLAVFNDAYEMNKKYFDGFIEKLLKS